MVSAITFEIQMRSVGTNEPQAVPDCEGTMEMARWLYRTTLDIIGVAGMGYEFNAIKDPNTELNITYRKVFAPSRQGNILFILGIFVPSGILGALPIKHNEQVAAAAVAIRNVCRKLIQQKKEARRDKQISAHKDILSVAMESGAFTEDGLVDQMMTFLAAGHETTATAMTWALLELCKHPHVQKRLREEVRKSLPSIGDRSNSITAEDVERVRYLHAVCNEVLRMHPPVPTLSRVALRDTTILGHFVPKGTRVLICPGAINMSTALWGEDAQTFNPERWMGTRKAHKGGIESTYSFLTFSHGMCSSKPFVYICIDPW